MGEPVIDERSEPTSAEAPPATAASAGEEGPGRTVLERIGLAAIALVIAALFGAIGIAALASGELFLGVMASIGALMTLWAAGSTLRRG